MGLDFCSEVGTKISTKVRTSRTPIWRIFKQVKSGRTLTSSNNRDKHTQTHEYPLFEIDGHTMDWFIMGCKVTSLKFLIMKFCISLSLGHTPDPTLQSTLARARTFRKRFISIDTAKLYYSVCNTMYVCMCFKHTIQQIKIDH